MIRVVLFFIIALLLSGQATLEAGIGSYLQVSASSSVAVPYLPEQPRSTGPYGPTDYVIPDGPNNGKSLREVLKAYTIHDQNGRDLGLKISEPAIDNSLAFYGQYSCSNHDYQHLNMSFDYEQNLFAYDFHPHPAINEPVIGNHNYMMIYDLEQPSTVPRLHLINLRTGEVESTYVAHGIQSKCPGDPTHACEFASDTSDNVTKTPLGFFTTGQMHTHGKESDIPLIGLERNTYGTGKGNAIADTLDIHSNWYVTPDGVKENASGGCPTMSDQSVQKWKDRMAGGALFYFYQHRIANQRPEVQTRVETNPRCSPATDAPPAQK